jgi:hypothetical protein
MPTTGRVGPPLPDEWADLTDAFYREWDRLYAQVSSSLFAEFPDRPPPCPWTLDGLSREHFTRQVVCYWALDRTDPATGKTPLRDWVERRVTDPRLREALLWADHPQIRDLVVCESIDAERVGVEDLESGDRFQLWVTQDRRELLVPGTGIHAAIHRWGRDWRLNGISQLRVVPAVASRLGIIQPNDVEDLLDTYLRREASRIDDRILRPSSPLTSVLTGYPVEWIDRICESLGLPIVGKKRERVRHIGAHLMNCALPELLKGVPVRADDVLGWLLDRGGVASRGALRKRFPHDEGEFWRSAGSNGQVSALRSHGLVVFGRVPDVGGRLRRTAFVPAELRSRLSLARGMRRGDLAAPGDAGEGSPFIGRAKNE